MITLGLQQTAGKRSKRTQTKLDVFLSLFRHVANFMTEHDGGNFKAFFVPKGDGTLGLYLMTEAEVYDFKLSAKLSAHVAPFVERGLLGSVMLVPKSSSEELGAFFDLESALCLVPQNTGRSI